MNISNFNFFDSDADETKNWINEKDKVLSSDDYGKDLASVNALLRKHEALERDLAAVEDKVEIHFYQNPIIYSSKTLMYYTVCTQSSLLHGICQNSPLLSELHRLQPLARSQTSFKRPILTVLMKLLPSKMRLSQHGETSRIRCGRSNVFA